MPSVPESAIRVAWAEQKPNAYLERWVTCRYFLVRKFLLFKYSFAFVALPGTPSRIPVENVQSKRAAVRDRGPSLLVAGQD